MRMQRFLISFVVLGAMLASARAASAEEAVIDPISHDFPSVHMGTSPTTTFTIENTGNSNVSGTLTESGTDCTQFSVSPTSVTNPLGNGQFQLFTVTFSPPAPGVQGGRGPCTYTLNDSDANVDTFVATGTATSPSMSTSTATLAFGDRHVTSQTTLSFTISNVDNPSNEILSYTIVPSISSQFVVLSSLTGMIPDGGSAQIDVRYTPTVRGAPSASTLTINGNDVNNLSDVVTLTGNGTSGNMVIDWVGEPGNLSCGSAQVSGGATSTCLVAVSNPAPGNELLTITSNTITMGSTDFTSAVIGDSTLTVGQSTNITITFNPSMSGSRTGQLTIGSDDDTVSADAEVVVPLIGSGTDPVISLTPSTTQDFGSVHLGSAPITDTVVVDNTGDADLDITDMTITGTNAADFSFASQGCTGQACATDYTVSVGADTETVTISCNPSTIGLKVATLSFFGDHVAGDDQVILNCTGIAPNIVLTNPVRAFSNVVIGTTPSPTLSFTIQNSQSASETLSYTFTKTGSTAFSVLPACTPGACTTGAETDTYVVTFNPLTQGNHSGLITINHNDPDAGVVTVTLSGFAQAPVIGNPTANGVPGQTLTFPNTDVGVQSAPLTITIENTGDAPLNISSVQLITGNAGDFMITSGNVGGHAVPSTAGTDTDTWQVRCTPSARNLRTTQFRINSDAFGTAQFNFTLNCTGLEAVFTFLPFPAGVNFGPVPSMTTAGPLAVTISNTGNKPGDVTNLSTTSGVYTFVVVGGNIPPARTVPNGSSITVNMSFSPVSGANPTEQLIVSTNGTPATLMVPLNGDGVTQGVDISVAGDPDGDLNVAMGNLRVGTTSQRLVTINNSGDTAYTVQPPNSDDARCVIAPVSPASYPFLLQGLASATFNVNVTPTALGAEACTITIITNAGAGTNDTVNLTFNGVAPEIALDAPLNGMLDFSGVDVDATPMQLPVQVRNSGEFTLTISSCAISGASAARFTIPACPNVQILPAETTTLMVTFDPTTEAIEGASLRLNVDALSTSMVNIPLTGIGLDQHLDLPALSYNFPDTFRNPTVPPVVNIVVGNPPSLITSTGAVLNVSMVMTDQAGIFEVTNQAYAVDPAQTVNIPVTFSPPSTGIFDGTITIMNDDTDQAMAEVTVHGNGIARNVQVSQGEYDIGVTGVGIPVLLSDVVVSGGIVISNIDPDNVDYTVRELGFVDADMNPVEGGPFRLIGGDMPQALGAGGEVIIDLEFVADAADEFETYVAIYLDGDPVPHTLVRITGEAVDVEIRGGGCQTGRDPGWAGLAMVGLGLGLLRRRRKLRASGTIVAALLLIAVTPVRADPTRNVEVSTFVPAPATEVEGFGIESPVVGVNGAWALGVSVTHATNVLTMGSESVPDAPVPIAARTALQLGFAYAFLGRFEAGLRLPLYQQSGDDEHVMLSDGRPFTGLAPAEGTALGDVAVHAKAQLVSTGSIGVAASLDITAPTATDGQFAGVDGPSAQLRAIAGWRNRRLGLTVNAGAIGRGAGDLGDIRQGNALTFGGGARFRALDQLWVIGEAFGSTGPGATMADGSEHAGITQLEGVLGVRYEVGRTIGVSVGAGRGLVSGMGSPDVRGFLLIDVAPRARKLEPLVIKKPPPPRDTRDDDDDGVVNADDACVQDAEDVDRFKDEDGCPEADNDEDGLLDGGDQCPDEPEDVDGTVDEDGCVDPDNDLDGILDVDDKCPAEAEDHDGYMDNDGCDEVDNDSDGIPDVIDQCALEPETINGNTDDDGCPDNGDSLVMIMPDRIEIFEPITFTGTSATLTKKSANVLGQVAATLRANRDFKRVRVTVHVHPRGNGDEELSRKRAKVVREWLVQWGIEPERVEDKGLGSSRPLVPKSQKGAAGLNDRVEFIILEKDVE